MQQEIMRTGNTVNFSITLTKNMAESVDRICRTEERNRSELVREALRSFLKQRSETPNEDESATPIVSSFSDWNGNAVEALPASIRPRKYTDAELAAIVMQYETAPEYSDIRAEAALWESALVADGLATADSI